MHIQGVDALLFHLYYGYPTSHIIQMLYFKTIGRFLSLKRSCE